MLTKYVSNLNIYWQILASGLGAAVTLPICGLLISAWGWESVFYITGIVGIAWSAMWFNLVFETPAEHPRITEYERYYIESQIAKQSRPNTKVIIVLCHHVDRWMDVMLFFKCIHTYLFFEFKQFLVENCLCEIRCIENNLSIDCNTNYIILCFLSAAKKCAVGKNLYVMACMGNYNYTWDQWLLLLNYC